MVAQRRDGGGCKEGEKLFPNISFFFALVVGGKRERARMLNLTTPTNAEETPSPIHPNGILSRPLWRISKACEVTTILSCVSDGISYLTVMIMFPVPLGTCLATQATRLRFGKPLGLRLDRPFASLT